MGQRPELNLEVTISPILRGMVAGQQLNAMPSRLDGGFRTVLQRNPITDKRSVAAWQRVSLRQDGARPMNFDGQTVLEFEGTTNAKGLSCTQRVSLFTSGAGALYLSLICKISQGEHVRSLHKASKLDGTHLDAEIMTWCKEVCTLAAFVTQSSPDAVTLGEIQDAFQSITSHCFLPKQSP